MDEIRAALELLESKGSFSTLKNIQADSFEIGVNKIGVLNFPIDDSIIKELIGVAKPAKFGWRDQTILDADVRRVWEIQKSKVKIPKKQMDKKFRPLLDEIKKDLGLPSQSKLTAELHNMLIYDSGAFFKPHQDTEKIDKMIATMVIVLPTEHEGGELVIDHHGEIRTYDIKQSESLYYSCIAFYADCYHEVKPVISGYRISLTFNLVLEEYAGSFDSLYERDFASRLNSALENHFYEEKSPVNAYSFPKLVYLLDHQYTQSGLSWDGLKNSVNKG